MDFELVLKLYRIGQQIETYQRAQFGGKKIFSHYVENFSFFRSAGFKELREELALQKAQSGAASQISLLERKVQQLERDQLESRVSFLSRTSIFLS